MSQPLQASRPKAKRGRRETPMPTHPVDPWPLAKQARLRELWEAGALSVAEIAQHPDIRMPRGAIAGKAHRMGLPPKASPIKPREATPEGSKLIATIERQRAGVAPLPAGHPLAMQILNEARWPD